MPLAHLPPALAIVIATLALFPSPLRAQAPWTAEAAFAHLQAERDRARPLYDLDAPHPDSVAVAIDILEEALAFRNSAPIARLAEDSPPLYYRLTDVSYDLAVAYSRAGRPEEAARALVVPLSSEYASAYASGVDEDSLLRAVRTDPTLAELFARTNASRRLFGSVALATAYRAELPAAEKAAGLSARRSGRRRSTTSPSSIRCPTSTGIASTSRPSRRPWPRAAPSTTCTSSSTSSPSSATDTPASTRWPVSYRRSRACARP